MTTVHYTARAKDCHTLELPEEAQQLGLKPGDEVRISIDQNGRQETSAFPPNVGMLAALQEIAERQKDRPFTSGADTLKLLREARVGAKYGYDPTE